MLLDFITGIISFDWESAVQDEYITIFIVGYIIVFAALVALYFIFYFLPQILDIPRKRELRRKGKIKEGEKEENVVTGEINAAISMALYLHFADVHDYESYISTIKRVSKNYSPWSSKIYSVRNQFNRL